ncbi:putative ABC transport system permease protein [Sphingomonas gellani]|uniref:Putative ABC transport system permease protein n=1 Tax=Sphingomonas gellani TaxID=1166340 RepID=A0A1H8GP75_9SPHN|nr:ABC transporter permease [Sphingomonas gellani]SEN45776.1 putative ABC transport system permease protein [Sphingomonas gellani]
MIGQAALGLYRTFARHRAYAVVNIGGLALGIAVCLMLGLYVRFELSFERWLPHHRELYLVQTELHLPGGAFNGAYPGTMAGLFEEMRQDFPGLVGTRIRGGKDGGAVLRGGEALPMDVAQVDPSFFDVFALSMVTGDGRRALADPDGALISRSAARTLFGAADPVGQPLTIAVDAPQTYRVAGIFEDLPDNTDLRIAILLPMPRKAPPAEWAWYRWGTASVSTFLRFPNAAAARRFEAKMPSFVRRRAGQELGPEPDKAITLSLLPVSRIHLEPQGTETAWRRLTVTTLGIVAAMTLLIAIVNYVNLATARSGLRAREVAMRKVLGADRGTLIRQFLAEAMLTVAVAALAGLIMAELALPLINAANGLSLGIPYALALPVLALLVLLVGATAGMYPALLLSSLSAAGVLASARSPGGGRAGTRLREALVTMQFGMATAFIIATAVLVAQTAHVRRSDLGFRRDGLIVVPSLADKRIFPDQSRAIVTALRDMPGVVAVGAGSVGVGGDGAGMVDVVEVPGRPGLGPSIKVASVGPDFFRAYGPRLLAGRLFDDRHRADDAGEWTRWKDGRNIVVNRVAAEALGFASPAEAVGKTVGGSLPRTIIGVIDQLRFFSPRTPDQATYFQYTRDVPPTPVAAIRFTGDPNVMMNRVRQTWRRLSPQVPLIAETADRRLGRLYQADDQAARLFGIGAGLAILIACVGLWGLASFNTARRIREIGIRKTLGASASDIVRLLLVQFLRPVLLANLIAWPLAYFAMRTWLAGFGDRIALSPVYFLAASLVAAAIAVLTALGQSVRASRAAPAWALHHD